MHRLRRSRFSNIFLQTKKPSSLDQMLSIWTKGNERFEDDQRIVERIQHWLEINAQSATTLFENGINNGACAAAERMNIIVWCNVTWFSATRASTDLIIRGHRRE